MDFVFVPPGDERQIRVFPALYYAGKLDRERWPRGRILLVRMRVIVVDRHFDHGYGVNNSSFFDKCARGSTPKGI